MVDKTYKNLVKESIYLDIRELIILLEGESFYVGGTEVYVKDYEMYLKLGYKTKLKDIRFTKSTLNYWYKELYRVCKEKQIL